MITYIPIDRILYIQAHFELPGYSLIKLDTGEVITSPEPAAKLQANYSQALEAKDRAWSKFSLD